MVTEFLASPGGKLSAMTALRNRQGWLMRGGERLVKKCSWMSDICSRLYHSTRKFKTFSCRCPSSVMVNNRFRSADYLPCQLFNFGMIATGNHSTVERWPNVVRSEGFVRQQRGRWMVKAKVTALGAGKTPCLCQTDTQNQPVEYSQLSGNIPLPRLSWTK